MSDWIKMKTDLYRHHKVSRMADMLGRVDGPLGRYVNQNCQCDMVVTRNVTRNVTVGALVSVWGVSRHRGERVGDDLLIAGASILVVDDMADLPGFGEAMVEVGWLIETEKGIVFPRFFDEMNIDPSDDKKEKDRARQQKHRQKVSRDSHVTVTPKCHAREEKRREEKEKSIKTPLTPLRGEAPQPNPSPAPPPPPTPADPEPEPTPEASAQAPPQDYHFSDSSKKVYPVEPPPPDPGAGLAEMTPEAELAHAWTAMRAGAGWRVPNGETYADLLAFFREKIRVGKSPAAMREAIEEPTRDRTEKLWQFARRELETPATAGRNPVKFRSSEEILAEQLSDPIQSRVLEIAFHGYHAGN